VECDAPWLCLWHDLDISLLSRGRRQIGNQNILLLLFCYDTYQHWLLRVETQILGNHAGSNGVVKRLVLQECLSGQLGSVFGFE